MEVTTHDPAGSRGAGPPARRDEQPGVDLPSLSAYLERTCPSLLSGPLRAELISGGRSNLTYEVSDGSQAWVLRRPPLGHVLPTAHDMGREYRVMSALSQTAVPVPRVLHLCNDPSVIGAPFYAMQLMGDVVLRRHEQLQALDESQAWHVTTSLVDTLAALHAVEPEAVGLGDLGRPEGYLARQVVTWSRHLDASRSRPTPELRELGSLLAASSPPTQRAVIVHGDYRLDNVMVNLSGVPCVSAVLDWEMATRGDALSDLAMLVVGYDGLRDLESPVAAVPAEVLTFPPVLALIDRYAARTGTDIERLPWHIGLTFFKLGAIFEGIHYRHLAGGTVGEGFDRLGRLVRPLAERGLAALGRR